MLNRHLTAAALFVLAAFPCAADEFAPPGAVLAENSYIPGAGVDARGNQVIDPTKNVMDTLSAAIKRLDDLSYMRAEYEEKLRNAQDRRLDDLANMRASYEGKIRELERGHLIALAVKETDRIDAIRDNDKRAVDTAAAEARNQATVLADQLAANAETLRTLVATTATATAQQLQQTIGPMVERLNALERGFNMDIGKGAGMSTLWGLIGGAIVLAVALVTLGLALMRQRSEDMRRREVNGNGGASRA